MGNQDSPNKTVPSEKEYLLYCEVQHFLYVVKNLERWIVMTKWDIYIDVTTDKLREMVTGDTDMTICILLQPHHNYIQIFDYITYIKLLYISCINMIQYDVTVILLTNVLKNWLTLIVKMKARSEIWDGLTISHARSFSNQHLHCVWESLVNFSHKQTLFYQVDSFYVKG